MRKYAPATANTAHAILRQYRKIGHSVESSTSTTSTP
jgi:hypothetical protein